MGSIGSTAMAFMEKNMVIDKQQKQIADLTAQVEVAKDHIAKGDKAGVEQEQEIAELTANIAFQKKVIELIEMTYDGVNLAEMEKQTKGLL